MSLTIPVWTMQNPKDINSPKVVVKCAGKHFGAEPAREFLEHCLMTMGFKPEGFKLELEFIKE